MPSDAYLQGELAEWPTMGQMTSLLWSAGLQPSVGKYSIRIAKFSHFIFQEYGGDLGDPHIDAEAEDMETLAAEAKQVSDIFTKAGIAHRFELYQEGVEEMIHCFQHNWPFANKPCCPK